MVSLFKSAREYLTPVLAESAFVEKGVLTPEEFVAAGDQLVQQFPTWEWCAGDETRRKPYLPPHKQYLLTRNVPCRRRARCLEEDYGEDEQVEVGGAGGEGLEGDDEGWLSTTTRVDPEAAARAAAGGADEDGFEDMDGAAGASMGGLAAAMGGASIGGDDGSGGGGGMLGAIVDDYQPAAAADGDAAVGAAAAGAGVEESKASGGGGGGAAAAAASSSAAGGGSAAAAAAADDDDDFVDVDDMAGFEEDNLVEDDAAALPAGGGGAYLTAKEPEDNIVHTRSYDLSLTYDKYYQTPRVWLFGYDEERSPLAPPQIFEDIMQDYAKKTVTIEAHPHLGDPQASVHPCQHAAVMKRIVDHLVFVGGAPPITQYLFIFLKFIQSVIPTVDYDFTAEVDAGTM